MYIFQKLSKKPQDKNYNFCVSPKICREELVVMGSVGQGSFGRWHQLCACSALLVVEMAVLCSSCVGLGRGALSDCIWVGEEITLPVQCTLCCVHCALYVISVYYGVCGTYS